MTDGRPVEARADGAEDQVRPLIVERACVRIAAGLADGLTRDLADESPAGFARDTDVEFADESVGAVRRPAAHGRTDDDHVVFDATGLWLIPGIVDCHDHLSWAEFEHPQADAWSEASLAFDSPIARAAAATLEAGVTSIRDAGGTGAELQAALDSGRMRGPRAQLSIEILGGEDALGADHLRARIAGLARRGAQWIKLAVTGGVSSPSERVLDPVFTEAEIHAAVDAATGHGLRVMAHAWGGDALTWSLEAGVASIEHGIFLTDEQAALGASVGATLVPTLTIYREVNALARAGSLPRILAERTDAAIDAHAAAVRRARSAGMRIALGTDFGTPHQHGRNLEEVASLMDAGLSADEALLAATVGGAELLAGSAGDGLATGLGGGPSSPLSGRLVAGAPGDAVILAADPTEASTYRDRSTVAAVIQRGRLVHVAPRFRERVSGSR